MGLRNITGRVFEEEISILVFSAKRGPIALSSYHLLMGS